MSTPKQRIDDSIGKLETNSDLMEKVVTGPSTGEGSQVDLGDVNVNTVARAISLITMEGLDFYDSTYDDVGDTNESEKTIVDSDGNDIVAVLGESQGIFIMLMHYEHQVDMGVSLYVAYSRTNRADWTQLERIVPATLSGGTPYIQKKNGDDSRLVIRSYDSSVMSQIKTVALRIT